MAIAVATAEGDWQTIPSHQKGKDSSPGALYLAVCQQEHIRRRRGFPENLKELEERGGGSSKRALMGLRKERGCNPEARAEKKIQDRSNNHAESAGRNRHCLSWQAIWVRAHGGKPGHNSIRIDEATSLLMRLARDQVKPFMSKARDFAPGHRTRWKRCGCCRHRSQKHHLSRLLSGLNEQRDYEAHESGTTLAENRIRAKPNFFKA